jgi:ABC-type branched-subunit amino acid transport system ATPase component
LLKAIYGLVRTRKGAVVLHAADGATSDLVNMRPSAITALGLNMVPQIANVFPDLSVRRISRLVRHRSEIGSTRSLRRCQRRCRS